MLLKKHHEATPEIQKRVNSLIVKWNELLHASSERGKGLEEAKDILKFNEEVEKVEDWIREKVRLTSVNKFIKSQSLFTNLLTFQQPLPRSLQ